MIRGRIAQGLLLVAAAVWCAGCPKSESDYRPLGKADNVTNTTPPADEHDHESGPHGGHIIELGKYHGELTMDGGRKVTLYILGGDAKTAAPVSNAKVNLHLHLGTGDQEVALTAAPLEGEANGMSSRFTAEATAIPAAIKDIEDVKGDVELTVDGKETTGEIEHDHGHEHDDHDHKPSQP